MRGGPTSGDGTGEDAGAIAFEPTLGDKFFHSAADPLRIVAVLEAAFEESFENTGSAVGVVPDEVLGIELGPILLEDAVVGFEVAPHFGLWVRRDDGDLRDVEFERGESTEIGVDDSGVSEGKPMM